MTGSLLALDRVSKRYWRGRHEVVVLDGVSLELEAGEFAAVFGRQASGKTTLLRVAAGIESPDDGQVSFAGENLTRWGSAASKPGLHPRMGWLRQSGPYLASMVMLDYVALPLLGRVAHPEAHRRATRALARMHAGEFAKATWGELSDAERIFVMIAQAVVREPVLLLADDPTKGLGETDRETVLALVRAIADESGMAVLMTVPDVPDMLRSHTVMTLSDGELMAPTGRRPGGDVIEFPRGRGESA